VAESGRVLGLDLGDVRIGVAISDPERRLAVPYGTVHTGAPTDVKAIGAIVTENAIELIVVGHPKSMSGESGPQARKAEELASVLHDALGLPVFLQDERLSTAEAERELAKAGLTGKKRRGVVDRSAATVILQAFLDAAK
jgi:putative Holliday junction resolvase